MYLQGEHGAQPVLGFFARFSYAGGGRSGHLPDHSVAFPTGGRATLRLELPRSGLSAGLPAALSLGMVRHSNASQTQVCLVRPSMNEFNRLTKYKSTNQLILMSFNQSVNQYINK